MTSLFKRTKKYFQIFCYAMLIMVTFSGSLFAQTGNKYNKFIHEILPNGLDLIIKHNPDSKVFAINILGKNRCANEPAGKDGITDFVNRMLVLGAGGWDAATIQNKLDDIGAVITANDNPYIPYDDRYTTRSYSFIKFETIDEYASSAAGLLFQIISKPDFPQAEIDKTKKKVMGIYRIYSGSTVQSCRDLLYRNLFAGFPFEKTEVGNPSTFNTFTRDDLVAYHKHFYAPNNMIMAIATSIDPDTIRAWILNTFGKMPKDISAFATMNIPPKPQGLKEVHQEMEKEQIYIYLGTIIPGLKSPDASAIDMASSIISSRMALNLREKKGFAYSVGMGVDFMPDFGWAAAAIGTSPKNLTPAREGMIGEINGMKDAEPSPKELQTAQNSTWGSMLLARASRINQAYYMCRNEFLGVGYDYEDNYLSNIRKVSPADIQRVARDYFDTVNMVIATVGKK